MAFRLIKAVKKLTRLDYRCKPNSQVRAVKIKATRARKKK